MIDLESVIIRRVNSEGIAYGEPIAPEDLRWEVKEEIAEALAEDEEVGEVEAGGQCYRWYLNLSAGIEEDDPDALFPGASTRLIRSAAAACRRVPMGDDGDWDARSARHARALTEVLGWSWDFSTWSHAAHILESEVSRRDILK